MQLAEHTLGEENALHLAQMAFPLMAKHAVQPTPENYAVWYQYAAGKNKDIHREIENIVLNSLKFTPETNAYLYNKYIVGNRHQKVLDEAAINGQKVLLEVLRVINDFSGETASYNQDIDGYLNHIAQEFADDNLKDIFKELLEATANLKQSGKKMSKKLEESTLEINSLRKNLQQVTIEAQRDFLTGVYNRKTFEKYLDEQMIIAHEHKTDLCLLMIDIDHFKRFNDRFGHLLGDEVLKIVARALTDTLKGRDVVARFGGEEFVVFLPDTHKENALRVAQMILTAIASKELKRKDTGETFGTITVSIGISHFRGETDTLPILIKRADDALYHAKRGGRNQAVCEGTY